MKMKKLVSLLMAAAMCATLLAGCGGSSNSNSSSSSSDNSDSSASAEKMSLKMHLSCGTTDYV